MVTRLHGTIDDPSDGHDHGHAAHHARHDIVKAPLWIHALLISLATAVIILCTLLPFLPGHYDMLAMPLSQLSQLFGKIGLLLVPVGALGLVSGYWNRFAGQRHVVAIAALIASSVVWAIVSLGALAISLSLGVVAIAFGACVVSGVLPRLKPEAGATPSSVRAMPFYLVVIPVAVALLQSALAGPAAEFGRIRAIGNSAPMIADIEQYRATHGRYPTSLLSLWPDYAPSVIGIREYHYEPSEDAYNLFFQQSTFQLGTREIVMYNPRDRHVMTSHKMDLLQLTLEELEPRRGHYAVHDARHPHWKYFWFD